MNQLVILIRLDIPASASADAIGRPLNGRVDVSVWSGRDRRREGQYHKRMRACCGPLWCQGSPARNIGFVRTPSLSIIASGTVPSLSTAGALAAHPAEHAKDVEHRQIKTAAGQRAKAGKQRLVFEFEGPCQSPFEIHSVLVRQFVFSRETRGSVTRIHRRVAVAQLRSLASRATIGIGLADDISLLFSSGYEL